MYRIVGLSGKFFAMEIDEMKKNPGKVLIGVDMVQLQDHVDTLKNLNKANILMDKSTKTLNFITDILDNVAMCEEDLGSRYCGGNPPMDTEKLATRMFNHIYDRCISVPADIGVELSQIVEHHMQSQTHFNGLSPAEAERLAILAEECSEVVQKVCKTLRNGYESTHPDGGPHE